MAPKRKTVSGSNGTATVPRRGRPPIKGHAQYKLPLTLMKNIKSKAEKMGVRPCVVVEEGMKQYLEA